MYRARVEWGNPLVYGHCCPTLPRARYIGPYALTIALPGDSHLHFLNSLQRGFLSKLNDEFIAIAPVERFDMLNRASILIAGNSMHQQQRRTGNNVQ